MSEKMRNCKACGQQIAMSAKSCPHCGAKVKKGLPVLIGILVFILLIVLIASAGNDTPKRVDEDLTSQASTNSSENQESTSTNTFKVGETALLRDVKVSFLGVTESSGSQFNKPNDGNTFILCEFEIANDSNAEITVSSMLSFTGYCDDYACSYSLSALLEKGDKTQLDGTIAPGKKMKGVIGYEVPVDWKELEVRFTPDFWAGKEIIFVASHP